jgi:hypothetical protein
VKLPASQPGRTDAMSYGADDFAFWGTIAGEDRLTFTYT